MPIGKIKKLINAIQQQGVTGASKEVGAFLQRSYSNYRENRIDRLHGTNTGGNEWDYLNDMQSPSLKDAEFYEPIKHSHFRSMLGELDLDLADYTFIDLGAGKGRALMFAADYPFKQIIGVEFSAILFQMMEKNIQQFVRKTGKSDNFQVYCADAAEFELPQSPIVLYLFNPFRGQVMQSVIDRIEDMVKNTPFPIYILYRNPSCREMFKQPFLSLDVVTPLYHIYRGVKDNAPRKTGIEDHQETEQLDTATV